MEINMLSLASSADFSYVNTGDLLADAIEIIDSAQKFAHGAVNYSLVMRNWLFVGLPFVLLGILFADIFRKKKEEYAGSYVEVMNGKKPLFILTIAAGIIMSFAEAFIFGKKEVFIGSLVAVIGIFLLSECEVAAGKFLYKIGKKSSNVIYYYHVLVIAVLDRLSYSGVIPYPPMWLKPVLVMALCLLIFYFAPVFLKKRFE